MTNTASTAGTSQRVIAFAIIPIASSAPYGVGSTDAALGSMHALQDRASARDDRLPPV
jgi:hypothetical protein